MLPATTHQFLLFIFTHLKLTSRLYGADGVLHKTQTNIIQLGINCRWEKGKKTNLKMWQSSTLIKLNDTLLQIQTLTQLESLLPLSLE